MTDYRFDSAKIQTWEKTPEGFVEFTAPIAKEGWLLYEDETGGVHREYVSRDTLRKTTKSFIKKPVSNLHPKGGVPITARNAKGLTVGWTSNEAAMDADGVLWLRGSIFDAETIAGVESGDISEISCGYKVAVAPRGDDWEQVDRLGNHIAAVPRGRAGPTVAFKLDDGDNARWCNDAIDAVMPEGLFKRKKAIPPDPKAAEESDPPETDPKKNTAPKGGTKKMKTLLDGLEINVDSMDEAKHVQGVNAALTKLRGDHEGAIAKTVTLAGSLDSEKARADALDAKLATISADLAAATERHDALRLDYDELAENGGTPGEVRIDADAMATAIEERMTLWDQVRPFLRSDSPDFEPDYTMNPIDIMATAVKAANPGLSQKIDALDLTEGESQGFIKGLFSALDATKGRKDSRETVDSILGHVQAGRAKVNTSMDSSRDSGRMDRVRAGYEDAHKRK